MINEIYKRVADELNLDEVLVKNTYLSYWRTIRDLIQKLPLKDNLTEEKFKTLRPNFNIGGLGKLCVTEQRFKGVKKKLDYTNKIKNDKYKRN